MVKQRYKYAIISKTNRKQKTYPERQRRVREVVVV
jgi:hypothetical protein